MWDHPAHCGSYHPWAGGSGLSKLRGGKPLSHSCFSPWSRSLPWTATLASLDDGSIKWNKSFPLQIGFGECFITVTEKQTRTVHISCFTKLHVLLTSGYHLNWLPQIQISLTFGFWVFIFVLAGRLGTQSYNCISLWMIKARRDGSSLSEMKN